MKEITTTITQRGQVTIPAEVRQALGLKPKDKVTFTIEGKEVRLTPASSTLEAVYGSVTPSIRPEDFEEISRLAKEDKAEETLRKMRKS